MQKDIDSFNVRHNDIFLNIKHIIVIARLPHLKKFCIELSVCFINFSTLNKLFSK